MKDKRYKWILYIIATVIVATIGIQIYWNYKNYQANKQQLINDVQISLDKAVDDYYADLAESTTLGISLVSKGHIDSLNRDVELARFIDKMDETTREFTGLDSLNVESWDGITVVKGQKADSMMMSYHSEHNRICKDSFRFDIGNFKLNDSIGLTNFELLTSKVFVAISNDSLNLNKIDSLVDLELERKNINIDKRLSYTEGDANLIKDLRKRIDTIISSNIKSSKAYSLNTTSKSSFLPKGSTLSISFSNTTKTLLKRSLVGILISTLLVLGVISCLFYLLKIIKHQKQLAEVKNDLISNITHEFKTPIATIGVALESINSFNGIDDKAKTKKYINMSSEQLGKLNVMVEKLLETATLDSENLELNLEAVNIVPLLNDTASKYKIQFTDKTFNTSFKVESLQAHVDLFHFENAINNILDNAVKYGGDIISIDLTPKKDMFDISISDNGNSLSKENKDKIFEKFYRIPKGNTHDVKGFGIGLYYAKTIVEKHGGAISLDLNKNLTSFKISLPNG